MEMLSSFIGDKHEFCLAVIKFRHVRSCPSSSAHVSFVSRCSLTLGQS